MKKITVSPSDPLDRLLREIEPGTRVYLKKGVYRQKIEITVPNTEIIGESPEETVIVYGDYAKKPDELGREYNTFRTYTAAVLAPHVRFRDITVENDAKAPEEKGQEVALTVYADDFYAENCRLISTQDTLFCGPLPPDLIERYDGFLKDELRQPIFTRQIYKNCLIAGTVDFIFGCADALFEECELRSLYEVRGHGYVAAPAHAEAQNIGFVFCGCRFTGEEKTADGSVFLARPWRDHGKASFIYCVYGPHIAAVGFDKWNDTERDKTARFSEYGSVPEGRVPWSKILSESEKNALNRFFTQE